VEAPLARVAVAVAGEWRAGKSHNSLRTSLPGGTRCLGVEMERVVFNEALPSGQEFLWVAQSEQSLL